VNATPHAGPIVVPADTLVVLVGVAGSGKTTFAARHFPAPGEVLASDAFRALVSGSEADQSATEEAFRLLGAALDARLARGQLTVVDATNTQTWARRRLLAAARRAGRPVTAIVLDLPLDLCLSRNASRPGRRVPERVVRRQHRELRRALVDMDVEDYAVRAVLRSPSEVAAARLVRTPDQSSVVEQSATSRT
jgi:predicted kinase